MKIFKVEGGRIFENHHDTPLFPSPTLLRAIVLALPIAFITMMCL